MRNEPIDPILYLNQNFSGLELGGGLFYRWPIGLRFDLGGRATSPVELAGVRTRATKLFEATFEPGHLCTVLAQDWRGEVWPHERRLFEFDQEHSVGIGMPHGKVELPCLEEPEMGPSQLKWATLESRSFKYEMILEGIAKADHNIDSAISSRVYFVNTITGVMLHMYDDRGMDVLATSRTALHVLYKNFNKWILDYDRHAIDRAFA